MALAAIGDPAAGRASAPRSPGKGSPALASNVLPHPQLRLGREVVLLAAGAGSSLLSQTISVDRRPVPARGLDPSRISLGIDRRVIGDHSAPAGRWSNRAVTSLVAWPFLLSAASAPDGDHLRAPLRILVPYAEATMLNTGLTEVLKRGISRPRPYTYLPQGGIAPGSSATLDVNAYLSFPSGHSSSAWCSAAFATVDHLLSRPRAPWQEQAAVAYAGSLIATTTSVLRVRAGQHFPTDVAGGAVLGAACGAGVPLLHAYVLGRSSWLGLLSGDSGSVGSARAPRPSRNAWLTACLATAAGAATVLIVQPLVTH